MRRSEVGDVENIQHFGADVAQLCGENVVVCVPAAQGKRIQPAIRIQLILVQHLGSSEIYKPEMFDGFAAVMVSHGADIVGDGTVAEILTHIGNRELHCGDQLIDDGITVFSSVGAAVAV